ncbi:MAG: hypothetical protein B7Z15_07660 [Rhizobiales bacterium 32-66-8]|nr:MAG: hypothetical protein B7Z15_07660 [Rhizobiales bacterium 32-66-8]
MKSFHIDMIEVMRLTRAGRVQEATALLQGHQASSTANFDTLDHTGDDPDTLDLVAPVDRNGAWHVPGPADIFGAGSPPHSESAFGDLMRGLSAFSPVAPAAPRSPAPVQQPEGGIFETRSDAAGTSSYMLYIPSSLTAAPCPLVVMLHGCTQSPEDFAAGTRMNALAEEIGFLVVYPAQSSAANSSKCWNWFETGHQARGRGEPALIAGITREIIGAFNVDPAEVFIAGLSAGGAAAAIMGQAYPEIYRAVGVHSGLACGAARDMGSAFGAMRNGGVPRQPAGESVVPTIVFHGDRDTTVHPVNADHVVAQAGADAPLIPRETQGATADGMAFTRTVTTDAHGHPLLEQWVLHGAGHAWSGGDSRGSYTDPRGPDASREMLRFFLETARSGSQGAGNA